LSKRWDWNVGVSYRYLETDAVVDAFNDSDFGLGGTNLKGYVFGGSLALAEKVVASARILSADNIIGPTYRVDVLQFDLVARY
jgi:Putative porin